VPSLLFCFEPDDSSARVIPIANTPRIAIPQHTRLKINNPWLLFRTSLFLKNIPAPRVEPITKITILKKPIFLVADFVFDECCDFTFILIEH
jgi:hypothetical protein